MEHNVKNICRIVISNKEQNLNKQMVEFRISILFRYFMCILAKFNTFSNSWKPISQFKTFSILSIPRGNPGVRRNEENEKKLTIAIYRNRGAAFLWIATLTF